MTPHSLTPHSLTLHPAIRPAKSTAAKATQAPSLRDGLRSRTALAHAEAEASIRRDANPATVDGYRRFLTAHLNLYEQFAGALDNTSDVLGLARRATVLIDGLRSDLAVGSDLDLTQDTITAPPNPPEYSRDAALGVAYVLEGSANGAPVLRAIARRQTGGANQLPAVSTRFIDLLCHDRVDRWPVFVAKLDEAGQTGTDVAAAAAGGHDVFRNLIALVHQTRSAPA